MAADLLANGTTAASSSDVTVTSSLTVGLRAAGNGALVLITLKDDAGGYNQVGRLDSSNPVTCIVAPGVYKFTRVAGVTCGVYSA